MPVNDIELNSLIVLAVVLFICYIWLKRNQYKNRLLKERKLRCKELILDNRVKLARAGVDFEKLVELVKQKIHPEHLEIVIDLLTAQPINYNIDNLDDPDNMELDLDFEGDSSGKEKTEESVQESDEEQPEVHEKMSPELEKKWLRVVHNRFRRVIEEKQITERQTKLRLLVKMVEIGKKTVEDDKDKSVARKEYEFSLWDRFYENEYLELQSE